MFPFSSRSAWLRGDRVAHTAAIAELAAPLLDEGDRRVLVDRTRAFTRWALVSFVLFCVLLVGTLTTAAGGVLAFVGLGDLAALVAAIAAGLAGLIGLAYALVAMHVNRLEADLWGVLALAALRRKA